MKLVLLSGGSGTRLWPLSSGSKSIQFLKILPNDSNEKESMIQRMFRLLKKKSMLKNTFVCTVQEQKNIFNEQIKNFDKNLIIEPERKDTFAAIALSTLYLKDIKNLSDDEVVCISPVDIFVEEGFLDAIQIASNYVQTSDFDIVLIGIKPQYPTEKYGYILTEESNEKFKNIDAFIEKPQLNIAKKLIEKGALWNSGFFAFKIKFIRNYLRENNLPTNYYDFLKEYKKLTKKSFDYAVMENATKAKVLSYDGNWNDLGTWDTLTELLTENIGKVYSSESCQNVSIINELDTKICTIGLENVVIVATKNGILISDKKESNSIKDHLKKL